MEERRVGGTSIGFQPAAKPDLDNAFSWKNDNQARQKPAAARCWMLGGLTFASA